MKKILFVVHRYAPYPGGSENYVRDMAEECLSRGHKVTVFAGEHKGDLNGVHVTSNQDILLDKWDLIIVHGGDVGIQNFVLDNAQHIQSPILYMLVKPSNSSICLKALRYCKWIGCSTLEDWNHVKNEGVFHKSVQVRHGINPKTSYAKETNFRQKYGIKTELMLVSSGGFWPNKAHQELVDLFKQVDRNDMTLVITGYDNRNNVMPKESENVRVLMLDDRDEVLNAIVSSDLYIMHSHSEGFGLVLLESMINNTPWASRNIAGAKLLKNHGFTYDKDEELLKYLKEFKPVSKDVTLGNYTYVTQTHLISNTVDDILELV